MYYAFRATRDVLISGLSQMLFFMQQNCVKIVWAHLVSARDTNFKSHDDDLNKPYKRGPT